MLFLQKRGHWSTCEHCHHNCSWFCCLCTSANRYWLTYCSILFSFSSSKSLVYRTWEKNPCVLNTEKDSILLQHNGTLYYKQRSGVPSCLKSKYFLFFLNSKVCVLQNSATFRFGGGLKLKLQRTIVFFFEWRIQYQYMLLSELELSTRFWLAEIPTNIHRW